VLVALVLVLVLSLDLTLRDRAPELALARLASRIESEERESAGVDPGATPWPETGLRRCRELLAFWTIPFSGAPVIYFLQASIGGPVKIGFAADVERRVRELQCGSPFPLRVLAAWQGDGRDERELHERFAADREHGEWFRPTAELRALIGKGRARGWSCPRSSRRC
jgi:Meiotically up-regulated gene 113